MYGVTDKWPAPRMIAPALTHFCTHAFALVWKVMMSSSEGFGELIVA